MRSDDPLEVLDYAPPPGRSPSAAVARAVRLRAAVVSALVLAAFAVPLPEGIWYFGHHPSSVVGVEFAKLTVGPSGHPTDLGRFPLLAIKLVVTSVPVWLIMRLALAVRRRLDRGGPLP